MGEARLWMMLCITAVLAGGYFAFRYLSLLCAIRKMTEELKEIQQDLTQNQILCLPIPNRQLGNMLSALNVFLEEIQTERQRYEKREKEFQRQIENVSHDLRTPLTVILGYLKWMKKGEPENRRLKSCADGDSEREEALEIIEQKAEIMKNLVMQFYDYSRINAGDYKVALNREDVSRILRESLAGNYQILEQTHLHVEPDIPEHPVWVLGDKLAFERIFLNLLQNAGRYAASYLRVTVKEEEHKVTISFINDTTMLSEEDAACLFQRFYMQDVSRSQGGTGLGLTVAKELAERMGAELNVHITKTVDDGTDIHAAKAGDDAANVCATEHMDSEKCIVLFEMKLDRLDG